MRRNPQESFRILKFWKWPIIAGSPACGAFMLHQVLQSCKICHHFWASWMLPRQIHWCHHATHSSKNVVGCVQEASWPPSKTGAHSLATDAIKNFLLVETPPVLRLNVWRICSHEVKTTELTQKAFLRWKWSVRCITLRYCEETSWIKVNGMNAIASV